MELFLFLGGGILLLYLIFKRIEEKKGENFEDREN